MAGEYNGAAYATILPTSNGSFIDEFSRQRQRQKELQLQQQRYEQIQAQKTAAQDDALARYAQQQTDGLVKKIDPKNPYNALLTTGLYDLKNQVTDFLKPGGASEAEVINLINNGAADIIDLNNRWNSTNAAIEQNSQAVKALGLDPKEVATKAREIAFYTPGKDGKLVLDVNKLKNADGSFDAVQEVYKNHADELTPVKPFDKVKWSKVNPSANDVFDPQTGDLLATKTFMNFIPGLHKPTMKDGKPYIGKVGEVQLVDVDQYGNETPLTHTVQVVNKKTGKTESRTVPLMGVNDETYAELVANNPSLEVFANQKLSAENRKLRSQGLPELTAEKASTFKRATVYDAIPEPLQPMQSTQNVTARAKLTTGEIYKRQANNAALQSQLTKYRSTLQTARDADYLTKQQILLAKANAANLFSANEKVISEFEPYELDGSITPDQKVLLDQARQENDASTREAINQQLEGKEQKPKQSFFERVKSLIPQSKPATPAPASNNKWDQYKRK